MRTETFNIVDIDTALKTMTAIVNSNNENMGARKVKVVTSGKGAYGFNVKVDGGSWDFANKAKKGETIMETARRLAGVHGEIIAMDIGDYNSGRELELVYTFTVI